MMCAIGATGLGLSFFSRLRAPLGTKDSSFGGREKMKAAAPHAAWVPRIHLE
jgi:hypothetical protein